MGLHAAGRCSILSPIRPSPFLVTNGPKAREIAVNCYDGAQETTYVRTATVVGGWVLSFLSASVIAMYVELPLKSKLLGMRQKSLRQYYFKAFPA